MTDTRLRTNKMPFAEFGHRSAYWMREILTHRPIAVVKLKHGLRWSCRVWRMSTELVLSSVRSLE